MERVIRIVLEIVCTSLLVISLLAYLVADADNGTIDVWERMGSKNNLKNNIEKPILSLNAEAFTSTAIKNLKCKEKQMKINQIYTFGELFQSDSNEKLYIRLNDVLLNQKSVMENGDIASLALVENPPAVLCNPKTDEIMFTKAGNYKISLIVGKEKSKLTYKEVWLSISAVSSALINEMIGG